MVWSIFKFAGLCLLVVAGAVGIYVYHSQTSADRQIQKLEQEKLELREIVRRLGAERRVADVMVTHRAEVEGVPVLTLLFVEYGRDGEPLPAKSFIVRGQSVHIDALVIKFDHDLVTGNDPLRGHSLALFQRIYGSAQTPESADPVDTPGQIPDVYRGADPRVSDFELDLWDNFWRLAEDPAYRVSKGVRIANGQGVWQPLKTDQLYTLTLETDGGINIQTEPIKGIYREALRRNPS